MRHVYSASNPTTPKGAVKLSESDSSNFSIDPIYLPKPITKGAFLERWRLERQYGRLLSQRIHEAKPDILLLSTTPLDVAVSAERACRDMGIPLVYWLQDLIGEATMRVLANRLGLLGRWIGKYYKEKERKLLRKSAEIIGITDDFMDVALVAGVTPERYTTIPNWAPLSEITPRPRNNQWSHSRGLDQSFVFLYSGTLGFKHNPHLFVALAWAFRDLPNVAVVVNSEGAAADWLRAKRDELALDRLQVNSFQPYIEMSDVLGTADVLVSVLDPGAGVYSVPSKVLTYHCSARPMLLAVPKDNLAAKIVDKEKSGIVVDPRDEEAFVNAAKRLYEDEALRNAMAVRARRYAERAFKVQPIADRFEVVLARAFESSKRVGIG